MHKWLICVLTILLLFVSGCSKETPDENPNEDILTEANLSDIYQRMTDLDAHNQLNVTIKEYAVYMDNESVLTDLTYVMYYQLDPHYFYMPAEFNQQGMIYTNDGSLERQASLIKSTYDESQYFLIFNQGNDDETMFVGDDISQSFINLFNQATLEKADSISYQTTLSGEKMIDLHAFELNQFITRYFNWQYPLENYEQADVNILFGLTDYGYQIVFSYSVQFNYQPLNVTIRLTVEPDTFEVIDVFSQPDKYIPIEVNSIEHAFPIQLNEEVELPMMLFDSSIHKIYLEPGGYQFISLGENDIRLSGVSNGTIENDTVMAFRFINANVEPHDPGYYIDYNPLQESFYVKEAGYYYVTVIHNFYTQQNYDYRFKLAPLAYDTTLLDDQSVLSEADFSVTLEGLYDAKMFIYEGLEPLTITLDSEMLNLYVYVFSEQTGWYGFYVRYPFDGSLTLNLEGPSYFFMTSSLDEDILRMGHITISYITD